MAQLQRGDTFADGQLVTGDRLNKLVDDAIILPPAINGRTELTQGNIQGNEEVLIYDPLSGALRKAQVQNLIRSGVAIETNYIEGAQYGGATGQLLVVTLEGLSINNGDTSNANSGISITSTGGNISITATNSGYGHGNGQITITSGSSGIAFNTTGTGNIVFNNTNSIKLPVGTTAQRSATPAAGEIRYNSTTADVEFYNGAAWTTATQTQKIAVIDLILTDNTLYTYPTVNSWASVPLNRLTETAPFVVNSAAFTGSGTSNSNITLPAGTYSVSTNLTIQSYGGYSSLTCRIYNSTTSTEIRRGNSTFCANSSNGTSTCYAAFVLTVETTINIQYFITNSASPSTTDGPGAEVMFSTMITKFA